MLSRVSKIGPWRRKEPPGKSEDPRTLERLARLLVDHSRAVAFVWRNEPGWPVSFVSQGVVQFGYQPADFVERGLRFAEIVHPEDLERLRQVAAEYDADARAEAVRTEYRILTPSKDTRWVEGLAAFMERGSDGYPLRYVGMIHDVTARKKVESELASLARFPSENPDPVLRLDRSGQLLFANPAAGPLLSAVRGAGAADDAEWRDLVMRSREATETTSFELPWRGRRMLVTVAPVGDAGYVNVYTRDVTAQHEAEQSAARSQRTLRALSRCYSAIAHASSEQELVEEICRIAVDAGGYLVAWAGRVGYDTGKTIEPVAGHGIALDAMREVPVSWSEDEPSGNGATGTAVRSGKPAVCRFIDRDPRYETWRPIAERFGFSSAAAFPLWGPEGVFGVFSLYAREPGAFAEDEEALLRDLAINLTQGILALRDRAEKDKARRELSQNEQRLERLFDGLQVLLWDEDWSSLWRAVEQVRGEGSSLDELLGQTPGRLREWFRGVVVQDVNLATVRALGCADRAEAVSAAQRLLRNLPVDIMRAHVEALWDRRPRLACPLELPLVGGVGRTVQRVVAVPGSREEAAHVPATVVEVRAEAAAAGPGDAPA